MGATHPHVLDFHAHYRGGAPSPRAVYSFSLTELERIPPGAHHTVGLHPWESHMAGAERLIDERLAEALSQPTCLGLGEVGLDRLRPDLARQEELLARQLQIADRLGRPAVLHCVRAWSELQQCIRRAGFGGRRAVHGFSTARRSILDSLLAEGYYLSLPPRLTPLAHHIPLDRLLAETDDTGEDIQAHHARLAEQLALPLATLQSQLADNAHRFFSPR
ncbi:MAG: hypothetical protein CSA07_03495 [Bacteroidia bacterium]|nr:MAG: hypothetical protein CSA07_03495 [Bacteroidia bacterium]